MTMTTSAADNRKPLITAEELAGDFAHLEKQIAEVTAAFQAAPPYIEDDGDLSAVGLVVDRLREVAKRAEAYRETTKEPYLTAGRTVDAYFKGHVVALVGEEKKGGGLLGTLNARTKRYLDKKKEKEERRRQEADRLAREELQRQEDLRRAAEEKAAAERRAAEEAAAEIRRREEAAAAEERRKQEEAAEAIRKAEQESAAAAETIRKAEEARRQQAAEVEREAARRRENEAAEAKRVAEESERQAARQRQQTTEAAAKAATAARAVEAPAADMARTRTDSGLATLEEFWTFEVLEPTAVDVSEFASFIPEEERNKAIARFVKLHKGDRTLKGVRIYKDTRAQHR